MKLKHLESALSSLDYQFLEPKIDLEQYPTSPHLASAVILTALERGDLGEQTEICDLGCGTGMLCIASGLVGCSHVIAVDCDGGALDQARQNAENMELTNVVDFIQAKLRHRQSLPCDKIAKSERFRGGRGARERGKDLRSRNQPRAFVPSLESNRFDSSVVDDGIPLHSKCVDTVIINPPFGTKNNAGIDIAFLNCGRRLARNAVYSFHKSSTRKFLLHMASEEWGMSAEVVAEMKFDIPNMYKFHKKSSVDVEVDLLRLWHTPTRNVGHESPDKSV